METIFDLPGLTEKIRRIESELEEDSFWQNNENAQEIFQTLSTYKSKVDMYNSLSSSSDDLETYLDLLSEKEDLSLEQEFKSLLQRFKSQIDALEIQTFLSGKFDQCNAIFSIHAGAGGTDAQDWAEIMLRMYMRFMEKQGYSIEVVEHLLGDEAGIKSATLMVKGDLCYGFLKNEIGIHRLVRLSPFNANNKRQTSFAAVDVIPELSENYKDLTLNTDDLKIDTFRASGAGGQHVNKTDSAVRITHIPSGIVAQSQASRSQGANKELAMRILTSRIIQALEKQHKEKVSELRGESKDISWGNQIRSYVFHPYKMVKDHRSSYETSNVDAVLDGDLIPFIESFLKT